MNLPPDDMAEIGLMMQRPPLGPNTELVIDETGVGLRWVTSSYSTA